MEDVRPNKTHLAIIGGRPSTGLRRIHNNCLILSFLNHPSAFVESYRSLLRYCRRVLPSETLRMAIVSTSSPGGEKGFFEMTRAEILESRDSDLMVEFYRVPLTVSDSSKNADEDVLAELRKVDVVFFSWGKPGTLHESLVSETRPRVFIDSPAIEIIRERCESGSLVVAGASAGGLVLSDSTYGIWRGSGTYRSHRGCLSFDCFDRGLVPEKSDEIMCFWPGAGFSLLREFLVDVHFVEEARFGRLMYAAMHTGCPFGLGVDSASMVFVSPAEDEHKTTTMEVVAKDTFEGGRGHSSGLWFFDFRGAECVEVGSSICDDTGDLRVTKELIGVRMSYVVNGDSLSFVRTQTGSVVVYPHWNGSLADNPTSTPIPIPERADPWKTCGLDWSQPSTFLDMTQELCRVGMGAISKSTFGVGCHAVQCVTMQIDAEKTRVCRSELSSPGRDLYCFHGLVVKVSFSQMKKESC